MPELTITSVAHDQHGRYYELAEDEPLDGVTVDELDGTITLHE